MRCLIVCLGTPRFSKPNAISLSGVPVQRLLVQPYITIDPGACFVVKDTVKTQ
ncbi:MAG: hypothetical protein JXA30_06945 [Deltaproteobacteria bacterium]|nr:hypothetical protein [Deltaproteobacteria bacterium]